MLHQQRTIRQGMSTLDDCCDVLNLLIVGLLVVVSSRLGYLPYEEITQHWLSLLGMLLQLLSAGFPNCILPAL